MSRIASIHLPFWPIERLARTSGAPEGPFALVQSESGGLRLTAVNAAARALGLAKGEGLNDARARVPHLQTAEAEPAKDRADLIKLTHWLTRFSPWAAPWPEAWGPFGISLDITGCAHLFGGEEQLAARIGEKLSGLGFCARLAIADTPGAAFALSCYGQVPSLGDAAHPSRRPLKRPPQDESSTCSSVHPEERALARVSKDGSIIIPPGKTEEAVRTLPVEALRLGEGIAQSLKHLGLKRIGDLLPLPRAPLAARFGASLLARLDQIRGEAPEPISPLAPVPAYRTSARLAEPIRQEGHILILMKRLAQSLMPALEQDGVGAGALRLTLYRVDGETAELTLRLARACRDLSHIEKLLALRLESLKSDLDAGFGFDAALLEVLATERLAKTQAALEKGAAEKSDIAYLIDRLGTRLGVANVERLFPRQSHIPERAVILRPAFHPDTEEWPEMEAPRPFLLLPAPEPAQVIASFPEGPPRQFRWRGVAYGIAHAEGPERIRPEWWRRAGGLTRDYYVLEDEAGRRFWVYRDGLYNAETKSPGWFVHGVFA